MAYPDDEIRSDDVTTNDQTENKGAEDVRDLEPKQDVKGGNIKKDLP